MNKNENVTFKFLPTSNKPSSLSVQGESSNSHSRLDREMQLFFCISHGDINRLDAIFKSLDNRSIIVGKLSNDSLTQAKYLAVSYATIACRMAIVGGMFESDAYKLCDEFIMAIDSMTTVDEITGYMVASSYELTKSIHDKHYSGNFSSAIRECTNFIYDHIAEKITLTQLAKLCGLTPSYLSSLFKKETGLTVSDYIMKEKMKEATTLLLAGKSCVDVSTYLGFCSQSYFCKCFKEEFGITPLAYVENPMMHMVQYDTFEEHLA